VSADELSANKAGCREVLSEVWAFLDNECDQNQRDILRQHLDECSPCLEQYGIEEHLKVLLARKCGGEHAPETLKERLRARIQETLEQHGSVEIRTTTVQVVEE
jgi:mycothiol system anti-sigma-R factor